MIFISMTIFLNQPNIFSRIRCLSKSKMKKNTIYDYPQSYFLNEFSMEFVGKNKMSPAEKRVMHARICMVCTIYAFYHCVNSFITNDMSGARIAFGLQFILDFSP